MRDLAGTPFEGSFLDIALRNNLTGDELYSMMEEYLDHEEDKARLDDDGRIIYDRQLWGMTVDEFGLAMGLFALLNSVVESYRRDLSVIEMLQQVADTGKPFPGEQADAQAALLRIDEWEAKESLARSVAERLASK